MRNKLALAAVLICALAPPAQAHCFSRWHYPWPQRCGAARPVRLAAPMQAPLPPPKEIDIPLPDIAFQACAEPDTRTAIMLRLIAETQRR